MVRLAHYLLYSETSGPLVYAISDITIVVGRCLMFINKIERTQARLNISTWLVWNVYLFTKVAEIDLLKIKLFQLDLANMLI